MRTPLFLWSAKAAGPGGHHLGFFKLYKYTVFKKVHCLKFAPMQGHSRVDETLRRRKPQPFSKTLE
jgi:hypothetical protein